MKYPDTDDPGDGMCLCGRHTSYMHHHLKTHHPQMFNGDNPTYKCVCGYESSAQSEMEKHFRGLDTMARKHHLVLLALSGG